MMEKRSFFIVTSGLILPLLLIIYLQEDTRRVLVPNFLLLQQGKSTHSDYPEKKRSVNALKLPTRDYLTEEEALRSAPLTDIKQAVSLEKSTIRLMDNSATYRVGEDIKLKVTLRNSYNATRAQGGDHLRVRIYNETLKAYAPGRVIDHYNGSYTAVVRALWPGKQTISVALQYTRETIRTIYYIRQKLPATRNIVARFSSGGYEEETLCHPHRHWLSNYSDICNFTLMNGGASWYCGKPKNRALLCEDWTHLKLQTPYPRLPVTEAENQLLGKTWDEISAFSVQIIGTMVDRKNLPKCHNYPKQDLWNKTEATGYFYNDVWYLHHCRSPSTRDFKSCLKDNHIMITGDSTTRAWYKYLLRQLACQPLTETWTKDKWHKRSACRVSSINFTMEWIPHGQPFSVGINYDVNRYTLNAISNQINMIRSDVMVIVVIHVFMHEVAYRHSVFRDRMQLISRSVANLLKRNKYAKVLIKGPHTYSDTPSGSQRLSDYFGYLYRDIIYEEFQGLNNKVVYMDQKDMTISKAVVPNHPPQEVVAQAVHQTLNYICE